MNVINILFQIEINFSMIYILLNLFENLCSIDISLININYLNISKRLYYVYAFNDNNKGDLYLEYWGEDSKIRYFSGLTAATGEQIYFNEETIFQIESNEISIYHDSILINNNEDNNIFSLNFINFDYINLKEKIFTSKPTKSLISENKCDSSYRNTIVKLKNNNYLLSIVICGKFGLTYHNIYFRIFNFNSENIDGYNEIKTLSKTIGYSNSTSCFQTENEYIECAFCLVLPINGFAVGIYDLDFKEKAQYRISYVKDYTFNKIFHFKKEIGVYLYFDKDTDVPKFQIKNLNAESFTLESLFEFDSISLNGDGAYSLNNGLFYSDGIAVDESRIVVILTTQDLLHFIICVFDLYNDDKSLRVRYYDLDLEQINIKISVNIYAFKFLNSFGVIFYNSNLEYPGYTIFGYPNINKNKIKLFINSMSFYFSFSSIINLSSNIFGDEIIGIKIINFPQESQTGVIIKSSNLNSEVPLNFELDINDQIIFEPSIDGAIPGEYILEFSPIIKEINPVEDSIYSADIVEYYGDTYNYNYQSKTLSSVYKLIYIVECYERCKTCTQLGSETYNYCVKCVDEFPYNLNNGEKCLCDKYLHTEENGKITCIEDCNNEEFKYIINETEKYCLSSCIYNNEELYLDEDSKTCYKNCSLTKNGNIYIYENKCISNCPENYIFDLNNECIFKEKENSTIDFKTSIFNKINIYSDKSTSKSIDTDDKTSNFTNNNIEKEIISSNININFETSLAENNKTNNDYSEFNNLKTSNKTSTISIDFELKSDYNISSLSTINTDKDRSSMDIMNINKTTPLSNSKLSDIFIDTSSLEAKINSDNLLSYDNETITEIASYIFKENYSYTYTSSFNTIEEDIDISSFRDINSYINNSNNILLNSTDSTILSDIYSASNSSLIKNDNNQNISITNIDIDSLSYKYVNTNSGIFSSIINNNYTEESSFNNINMSEEINVNEKTENSFMEIDIFFNKNESNNKSEFIENNFIVNKNEYKIKVNLLINDYNQNNSELEIQTENNCIIYCYSSKADINNLIRLNPDLYYINLKECENKLIKEYDLNEDSDLLIIINDNQNNRSDFFYEIYTRNGVKISNLSVCENSKLEVSSPIINLKEVNYEYAILLESQGYDIYNIWSSFYYDFCSSAYINESDLTLSVRQQEIFPNNISICMNGCSYDGINLDIKRFYCLCSPNLLNNEEESEDKNYFEEVIKDNFFIYIVDMINYQIFSCYKLVFEIKNYFYNFGFYYAFGINFINIILIFIYHTVGRKKIKIDFFHHEPNVWKTKEIEEKFINIFLVRNIKDNKDSKIPKIGAKKLKRKKKKFKTHTNKNYNLLKSSSNPVKKKEKIKNKRDEKKRKTEISKKLFGKNRLNIANNSQSEAYFENSNDIVFKREEILKKIKNRNNNLLFSKNTEDEDKIDYNELSYYEALQKDNRNILQIFFSLFNLKIQIIQLSLYSQEFSHKSLTLPLYLFDLLLDVTINALLFSDDIISQKYYNNGQLKMITSNLLSISSIIISNIILYFARILINNCEIFNMIVKEIKNQNDYYRIYIKISCILRLKIAVFFLLIILIEMTSMYYLFVFCAIYKKIQKNLFINYIIGSCWQLVYTIGICFLITILRKIGLNKKIKRLFIISRFIDEKL